MFTFAFLNHILAFYGSSHSVHASQLNIVVHGPSEMQILSLHDALPILVWANSLRLGLARPFGKRGIPLSERFFSGGDRKSTRLNSSHSSISYAVFCLKKKRMGKQVCCDCLVHHLLTRVIFVTHDYDFLC